jgi:hypothetical protein
MFLGYGGRDWEVKLASSLNVLCPCQPFATLPKAFKRKERQECRKEREELQFCLMLVFFASFANAWRPLRC